MPRPSTYRGSSLASCRLQWGAGHRPVEPAGSPPCGVRAGGGGDSDGLPPQPVGLSEVARLAVKRRGWPTPASLSPQTVPASNPGAPPKAMRRYRSIRWSSPSGLTMAAAT